jgi:hypothetical protein
MRSPSRAFALVSSAAAAIALPVMEGCSGHSHGGPQSDEYVVNCETTDAGVTASDENFRAFINAEAAGSWMTAPADKLPIWVAPAAGATLSVATPPTFTFSAMAIAAGAAGTETAGRRLARACAVRPAARAASVWRRLASELTPIRRAEAHCPPVSGQKYLLRLATASGDPVYSATLSVTSFTPDQAVWSRKLAGRQGQTLKVTLVRALFAGDDIGEGPYVAADTPSLTVGP